MLDKLFIDEEYAADCEHKFSYDTLILQQYASGVEIAKKFKINNTIMTSVYKDSGGVYLVVFSASSADLDITILDTSVPYYIYRIGPSHYKIVPLESDETA